MTIFDVRNFIALFQGSLCYDGKALFPMLPHYINICNLHRPESCFHFYPEDMLSGALKVCISAGQVSLLWAAHCNLRYFGSFLLVFYTFPIKHAVYPHASCFVYPRLS